MPDIKKWLPNRAQWAIIGKDYRAAVSNKMVALPMYLVPAIFVVVYPLIFLLSLGLGGEEAMAEFGDYLSLMPSVREDLSPAANTCYFILNYAMPMMFMLIPLMTASVTAASSFVGEKEQKTLETLLFCPLTVREIFTAKAMGCMILALSVSFLSFICYVLVVSIAGGILFQAILLDAVQWILTMLALTPAVSLIGVILILRTSAKAETFQEAQQASALAVFPFLALMIVQIAGVVALSWWMLVLLSLVLWGLALLLLHRVSGSFTPEKLLK